MPTLTVNLPRPHPKQREFIESTAKRKVIRAGRRGGKTVGMAIYAVEKFLAGKRVLYAAPTGDQIDRFWSEVTRALREPIESKVYYKNETKHIIELAGTEQRIRAKTAWNAASLRGDYADVLILDEYQLMDETAWSEVGAPMLLDNNGDAVFIYTPPSLQSRSTTKARDPQHAAKLFKKAQADKRERWAVFHFSSMENPHLSTDALDEIAQDMTSLAYRQEIKAEDVDEAPGALWKREWVESGRCTEYPDLERVVVGVDPSATSGGDEAGIITAGRKGNDYYTIADNSKQGSPEEWAREAVLAFIKHNADAIVAEKNNGGDMVKSVIEQAIIKLRQEGHLVGSVPIRLVWASRGKETRAEPISAIAEQGRDHHVGAFPHLEDELCMWMPGQKSPNRLDAKVWALTDLSQNKKVNIKTVATSYTGAKR